MVSQMKNETKSLFVSIVGKPNAGKSSIMNMLINSKISIVSPKPQTTRSRITGILTEGDTQLVFVDTPGIHKPFNKLSEFMISEVDNSFSGSELCLHVVDAEKNSVDTETIAKLKKSGARAILALNKVDLLKQKNLLMAKIKEYSELYDYDEIIPVSAASGEGKEELLKELFSRAVPSVFFFPEDDITDQTERMLVCEIIREKLLYFLEKELPHGTAVQIEKFKEREDGNVNIHAVIYCERKSHKAIIVGAGGQMIKKIGIASRKAIGEMLDCNVNLNLFVKVKEDWRNSASILHDLGYM